MFLLLAAGSLPGAAQTAAVLSGLVTDPSGSVIPGATLDLTNLDTGAVRTLHASADGRYTFAQLAPGNYRLVISQNGFQRGEYDHITLTVSQSADLNVKLAAGSVEQTVTVSAESERLLDSATDTGTLLPEKAIEALPINGRDYARFAMLTPGAVATTNIIANISFNGQQITANRFTIDGIDATRVDYPYIANGFERGARLLTGSLETISQFRSMVDVYPAEYGRSAGAYVNIATKSGSNRFHGSVYDFLRNDFFDARNYFNAKPAHQAETRFNDFGGSISGPIFRDKTFLFLNYEGTRQIIGITQSNTTMSDAYRAQVLAKSPALAPIVANFPTGGVFKDANTNTLTTTGNVSVREDTGSARIDQQFGQNNTFYARFNVNDSYVSGVNFGVFSTAQGVNDHQNVPIRTTNVAIHDQQLIGAHFINEFLAGVQRFDSLIESQETTPLTTITGFSIVPGSRGRQANVNTSWQIGDNMTYVIGNHTLKWGLGAYRLDIDNRTAATQTITYTSIADFINNSANSAGQTGANPGSSTRSYETDTFVQDTWKASPKLTVDYGVRWDFQTTPWDIYNKVQTFLPTTNALSVPGYAWYDQTYRDFSPRFGINYRVLPRLSIRTGFGIFYQQFPLYSTNQLATNNAAGTTSLLRASTPTLSYPLDAYLALPSVAKPAVAGFQSSKPDQYTEQWHLTTETSLSKDANLLVAYVGNRSLHLRQQQNVNLYSPTLAARPLTNYANVLVEQEQGISNYNALHVQFTQRMHHGLFATASYSYAHGLDNVADNGISSSNPLQPQTFNDWRSEYGNATSDIRHSLNYSLTYDLPFGKDRAFLANSGSVVDRLAGGWQIASIGFFRTGAPETILIGVNTSGNQNTTNQRPNRVKGVSQYAAHKSVSQWFNPAAFSTPAAGTVGNLGRNTVYGQSFNQLDMSLLKNTKITEKAHLQLRWEVFNVPNHPLFALPSNTFNTSSFGQILNTYGRTTGSGTSRQMQLGAKVIF
ncbi:carboxypeptidase regulatory-like domain-containing protein [Granulicella cerasi]|uniref:Carboxypeptidase regulatory-like domain-containing protein n=1 Tax=Granulicella cerasi TaxID=741063 RepID=A0ABW1ZA63_9BACT|nr:carboxypeptidase regulatory-like domain-containing protein [Granulicella cerasi]